MGLPSLKDIFSKGAEKLVTAVGNAFDQNFSSKEEKEAAKLALVQEVNRHTESLMNDATEQMRLVLSDKQNAREMFKFNSGLQKIYAIVFLSFYIVLSSVMIYMIYIIAVDKITIAEWGIGFISTIWGAMSTKVGTVTDFLFGASMTPERKD